MTRPEIEQRFRTYDGSQPRAGNGEFLSSRRTVTGEDVKAAGSSFEQPVHPTARVRATRRERRSEGRASSVKSAGHGDPSRPRPSNPLAVAFLWQVELAALDLARLGRRVGDDYSVHLIERVGDRVECLDLLVQPTAGELVRAGVSVDEALARVDSRAAELRRLLGRSPR